MNSIIVFIILGCQSNQKISFDFFSGAVESPYKKHHTMNGIEYFLVSLNGTLQTTFLQR